MVEASEEPLLAQTQNNEEVVSEVTRAETAATSEQ